MRFHETVHNNKKVENRRRRGNIPPPTNRKKNKEQIYWSHLAYKLKTLRQSLICCPEPCLAISRDTTEYWIFQILLSLFVSQRQPLLVVGAFFYLRNRRPALLLVLLVLLRAHRHQAKFVVREPRTEPEPCDASSSSSSSLHGRRVE